MQSFPGVVFMILNVLDGILSGSNPLLWLELALNNWHWTFAIFAFIVITFRDIGINHGHFRNFLFRL